MFTLLKLLPFILPALADVVTGIPDSAPPGFEQWTSEIVLPAKDVVGDGDWGSAVARARTFVAQLTLEEKVNVTTGADIFGRCVGNTGVCQLSLCFMQFLSQAYTYTVYSPAQLGWSMPSGLATGSSRCGFCFGVVRMARNALLIQH